MAIPGIEARFASVRINTGNWRIRARSNISSPVVLRDTDLRQILLVLPRQAREPDWEVVPFGKGNPAPLTGRGIGVFAQQTRGQPKWQGRFPSRTLRAMNTSIRPCLDTPIPAAMRDRRKDPLAGYYGNP